MKITAEFNNVEEMKEFGALFNAQLGTVKFTVGDTETVNSTTNKTKSDNKSKVKDKEKAKVETPKEEVEKVEAEVTGVDNSTNEDPKDAEVIKEDKPSIDEPKITKEMVRDIFAKVLKAGKAADAKALTSKYGAKKVTEIKEEDYPAIYAEAKELIG